MVLYVFVVAYVGGGDASCRRRGRRRGASLGDRCSPARCSSSCASRSSARACRRIDSDGAPTTPGSARPRQIGELLLTKFLLPFEVASFLLLIAAVGAVVLARRRGGIERPARASSRRRRPRRPSATGTMAEGRLRRHGRGGAEPRSRCTMSIDWYLVVSALVFCIGAGGVLTAATRS